MNQPTISVADALRTYDTNPQFHVLRPRDAIAAVLTAMGVSWLPPVQPPQNMFHTAFDGSQTRSP